MIHLKLKAELQDFHLPLYVSNCSRLNNCMHTLKGKLPIFTFHAFFKKIFEVVVLAQTSVSEPSLSRPNLLNLVFTERILTPLVGFISVKNAFLPSEIKLSTMKRVERVPLWP